MAERQWIHPVREAARQLVNGLTFTPSRLNAILGNHVVLRSGALFAGFAHLAPGTVAVRVGQRVRSGEVLGGVGHTGNSTSPHLHFQLMDAADPLVAKGLPCAFRSYEVQAGDGWTRVADGIPGRHERLRFVGVAGAGGTARV
jgi:murein DD-endopeptidase MepM/ murein hydrolase activator NlpD